MPFYLKDLSIQGFWYWRGAVLELILYGFWVSHCSVAQSCPTLCDPMNCSLPGSSVHGILQPRILEWVAISYSRGSSQPEYLMSPALTGVFFTTSAPCKAHGYWGMTTISLRWGHEGGAFIMGLVPLKEQTWELDLSLSPMCALGKKLYLQARRTLTRNKISQHFDLGLIASKPVRVDFCFCSLRHTITVICSSSLS